MVVVVVVVVVVVAVVVVAAAVVVVKPCLSSGGESKPMETQSFILNLKTAVWPSGKQFILPCNI